LDPEKILEAGWDKLVEVLDRGHYVRYDFSTTTFDSISLINQRNLKRGWLENTLPEK